MALVLRRAKMEDAERLLAWRNDPATRAASFQGEPIALADHLAWLERRLADPDCLLGVIESEGTPSGSLRLDRESPGRAEVHIALAPETRGLGLAAEALREGCRLAGDELRVSQVRARVKRGNEPSLHAFAAAGFERSGESEEGEAIELTRAVDPR